MAKQAPQQSSGDNSMAPIWIIVLLFISAYLLWVAGHKYIVSFVFYLNILQAKLINFFISSSDLSKDIYLMQTLDPASVDWNQMNFFSKNIGDYTRYPIAFALVAFAVFLYKSNITLKFRKTYSMSSLSKQEQYNWPAIMPVVQQDLVSTDINKGPWAMALSPMEFARKYALLKKNDTLLDNPRPGYEMTAAIRRGDAKRIFTLQLGAYWEGFEQCPAHVRALAAVFMARMNRDRASSNKILVSIDKSFAMGKLDFSVANSTLKKYQNSEMVQAIVARHAYLFTVMGSLLFAARDDGVVPCSEFLWLKTVDRRLWYMCNSIGRQTPFAEVGGPFAHWKAEKAMRRGSMVPMIDEAIRALEVAIKEIKLTEKELQELKS